MKLWYTIYIVRINDTVNCFLKRQLYCRYREQISFLHIINIFIYFLNGFKKINCRWSLKSNVFNVVKRKIKNGSGSTKILMVSLVYSDAKIIIWRPRLTTIYRKKSIF